MDRDALICRDTQSADFETDIERRRALGIYYTPRNAATMLAKWAIRSDHDTILEPSFGGCAILEAALNQLRSVGCVNPARQIFGFDVDDAAFAYLRRLLGANRNSQFSLQDFLEASPGRLQVSAIIANPPFVSYHRMNRVQRKAVLAWRERNAPPFAMTASLWAYFLIHSLSFLKPNGRLAFILPSAATSSDYARPVMTLLEDRFAHLSLYRMNEQLFVQIGAEERTVVLLAEGYLRGGDIKCNRSEHSAANLRELGELLAGVKSNVRSARIAKAAPSSVERVDRILCQALARGAIRGLGEAVDVSIGEVIGDAGYFVKRMDEWAALGIPASHLRPIITRMAQVSGLQITLQEVSALYGAVPLLLSPSAERISKKIRRYLDCYPVNARLNNKTFAKRNPWYQVSYDCGAAGFISSLSHNSPKIVLNSANISCANGLYKLVPRRSKDWHSWIAAASLTTLFRFSAEQQARVRGSGALKLEPSDVRKLLIPTTVTLDAATKRSLLHRLDMLVRCGEYESASRMADEALLLRSGIFTIAELNLIRNRLQDLHGQRLPSIL